MQAQICVQDLTKIYRVPEREAGLKAAVTSLVRRKYNDVLAVDRISFEVRAGEMVGSSGRTAPAKRPRSRCCRDCSTPAAAPCT
jgi:ABC-2 type transport system ATP-binding protein